MHLSDVAANTIDCTREEEPEVSWEPNLVTKILSPEEKNTCAKKKKTLRKIKVALLIQRDLFAPENIKS